MFLEHDKDKAYQGVSSGDLCFYTKRVAAKQSVVDLRKAFKKIIFIE